MKVRDEQKDKIVTLLREQGPASRPALARSLGVNLPTISGLTRELIDLGLLCESGYEKSDGGRRAARLALRGEHACAIGLEISLSAVRGVVMDLNGSIVDEQIGDPEVSREKGAILDTTCWVARTLRERNAHLPLRGAGVAVAGLVDEKTGCSLALPHVDGWKNVPLAEMIGEATGLAALIGNDVQASTLAEQRYGAGRGLENFIYLHIRHGIAAGMVIHGRLYAGSTHNAGEFGHTVVERDGPVCYCGNLGCLESLAAPPAVCAQADAAIAKGVLTRIGEGAAGGRPVRIGQVLRTAAEGDRLASNLVERAGAYIGVALAGLVNVLNPEVLIYGGLLTDPEHELLREAITRPLLGNVLTALRGVTEVRIGALKGPAASMGGAALVFEALFASGEILFEKTAVEPHGAALNDPQVST